jgi:argonaute-like protein implicated in RNA metabolism and viral defense
MMNHIKSHDEHLTQIEKLQKRLVELESVNPQKKRESAQQKEIDVVKDSLAALERTTEQLIHSSDAQQATIKRILAKSQSHAALLETNTQLKKNMRRVRIDDRN